MRKPINKTRYVVIFFLLIAANSFISACNLIDQGPDTEATAYAETISAELTIKAPTATRFATKTPRPSATATLPPTDTPIPPTPIPSATPLTIYSDDFSKSVGWASADQDNFAFGIENQDYFIFANAPNAAIWSVRYEEHTDVRVQTHAMRTKGPEGGYYGVVCRFVDASNYYMMVIAEDGFYGIAKMFAGGLLFISEGKDEAGIIKRGETSNQVEGDCLGSNLSLVVNGQTLLQVEDPTHKNGMVGLVAGSFSNYGIRVTFNDFLLLQP